MNLYIRSSAEVSERLQEDVLAYTSTTLDLQMKPDLEARDQWTGRGLAVWLNTEFFFDQSESQQLGVLLHELSHCLSNGEPTLIEYENLTGFDQFAACGGIRYVVESFGLDSAGVNYERMIRDHHDVRFARAALHLAWRARHSVDLAHVHMCGAGYSFDGSCRTAANALHSELVKGGNLFDVLETKPPQEFADLFTKT